MMSEYRKNHIQVFEVIVPTFAIDEYVVEENQKKLPKYWLKDVVHKALECTWRVCKTKGHNEVFVVARVGFEGCLMHVVR